MISVNKTRPSRSLDRYVHTFIGNPEPGCMCGVPQYSRYAAAAKQAFSKMQCVYNDNKTPLQNIVDLIEGNV